MRMGETIGQVEHYVVSAVAKFIPESVRTRWHEWRQSLKKEEEQRLGNNDISDKVEMVGWGVEKAEERNKEEASESEPPPRRPLPSPPLLPLAYTKSTLLPQLVSRRWKGRQFERREKKNMCRLGESRHVMAWFCSSKRA
jgi:hypothetical protein